MKFRLIIAIALCTMLAFGSVAVAAEQPITAITVDGSKLDTKLAPVVKNGTTYVPMIPYFKALDATVVYDAKTKKANGKRGTKSFSLTVGSKSAKANGKTVTLSQPPLLIGKEVYVPYDAGKPLFGAVIEKNAKKKTINVRGYGIDLTVKDILPVNNDRGEPLTLQHRGNVKLLWHFTDESPYQQYTGFVGPDRTLIFKGFGDRIDTDYDGRKVYEEPYEYEDDVSFTAYATENGYRIIGRTRDNDYEWNGIPLHAELNRSPIIYIDGEPSYDVFYTNAALDANGNLIVLTVDGLAAYSPEGERLWVRKEWPTIDGTLSAFEEYLSFTVDSGNRLYIQNYAGNAILDAQGNALYASKGYFNPIVAKDGLMLSADASYRLEDGKLVEVAAPYRDYSNADYVSLDSENSLKRMDASGKKPLWIYEQPLKEKNRGYSLFNFMLVVDGNRNAYITTNGGTVHSLDAEGNLRFVLGVDNGTISGTQILPLSPTTFIAIDNNNVMCFEVTL
ncbi:copper amine oxidase N-terminal domain-containing protein [Cohnella sp. GCM10027633]|uniref:copper amine oxidase N-terminal domain-containing protein n=1 Tax=unclassified Cohnella TaxID=2636738 RepID=UPI003645D486